MRIFPLNDISRVSNVHILDERILTCDLVDEGVGIINIMILWLVVLFDLYIYVVFNVYPVSVMIDVFLFSLEIL